MTGSELTSNFVSMAANLSLGAEIPALVKADSILLIHISMLLLSSAGSSVLRGTRRKSEGCGVAAVAVAANEIRTASRAAATDVSVAALTVASTSAFIEAGSILMEFEVVEGAEDGKNASSEGVGEGVGVRSLLALSLACGDG